MTAAACERRCGFRVPVLGFLLLVLGGGGWAAEWQWSVSVEGGREKAGAARAFLWLPPTAERIRGLVVAQHNMEEISILEHPKFRESLSALGFGEVWCAPAFDHVFRFDEGAGDTYNRMIEDLANESGYAELKFAPIVGIGHSAAASWPYYFAAWAPERTLAAISVSGQWPYFRDKTYAPDVWGERTVDFIPCLETMGEYEAANTWSAEGLKERQQHPLTPLSMLACPAEGHFAASTKKVEYLALYLKKAAQYRLPEGWSGDAPPKLRTIDPTKTGWLADRWRLGQPPRSPAAPVGKYQGDASEAFWYFDEEIARATERYGAAYRGLKPQLVGFVQAGEFVSQTDSHLQVTPKFTPDPDLMFKLSAGFYETVPSGSPRVPRWSGLPFGAAIGHSVEGGAISIDRICGPIEKLAPDTFAFRLQREATGREDRFELVLAASHPGDGEYKAAVQQAHIFVAARNIEGAEQHITFPEIPEQKVGNKSVKLRATSSANVPVYYYVREGPAEVEGDTLRFTQIPLRAKFPAKVTVVGWQYGRLSEPKLKTAEPVSRTFGIIQ